MLARLHDFIREVSRRQRSGFVKGSTITEAINNASSDLWRSKIKEFRAGGSDILLQPFKSVSTLSAGSYTLTSQIGAEIVSLRPTDESELEIVLTQRDNDFISVRTSNDYKHLTKSQFTASINAASSGFFPLPDDTHSLGEVFYHEYQGARNEGQMLEDREFLDRKNSVIVPASVTKPIARIVDNQIEFAPIPTGATTYTFTVPYNRYNPVARYNETGSDIVFEFLPSSYNQEIKVYYYRKPVLGAATYAYSNGVETITVTQELDWGESAFPELAYRSLVAMGFQVNNQLLTQIESLIEQNNSVDANN